jgi:hypothetical protein
LFGSELEGPALVCVIWRFYEVEPQLSEAADLAGRSAETPIGVSYLIRFSLRIFSWGNSMAVVFDDRVVWMAAFCT